MFRTSAQTTECLLECLVQWCLTFFPPRHTWRLIFFFAAHLTFLKEKCFHWWCRESTSSRVNFLAIFSRIKIKIFTQYLNFVKNMVFLRFLKFRHTGWAPLDSSRILLLFHCFSHTNSVYVMSVTLKLCLCTLHWYIQW